MAITASMVKELRERTGAGMMECKKALVEANGDIEEAIVLMRKSGQVKAAKRSGRITAEGAVLIALNDNHTKGFMIEVNSETDFVARDQNFVEFAERLVKRGLETQADDVNALLKTPIADGDSVMLEDKRSELVAQIGENIQLRRLTLLESSGVIGTYRHGTRIGVMVALDKNLPDLANDIAMHIAAMNPLGIEASDIPADLIEKERAIFLAQAQESGKSDDVVEKMVAGRVSKFLKEVCLLDQPFVKDSGQKQTIKDLLKAADAQLIAFVRFEVGEGIEKESVDFAEEVHAQIKQK